MSSNNDKPLKPFFCRIGNKTPMMKQILPRVPTGYTTYVEPFVGSGSVFLSLPKVNKEVINDLDKPLINAWKLLKTAVVDPNKYDFPFSKKYHDDVVSKEECRKGTNKELISMIQSFVNKKHTKPQNKLLSYLYVSCNGFSGKTYGKMYKHYPHFKKIAIVNDYKMRLQNTTITNEDYKKVVKKHDGLNTFFFLDPPYEKSKGLYKNAVIDYVDMADLLSKLQGKFMLTINDSEKIRDIFKQFNITSVKVKGRGNISQIGMGDRDELIITNYKLGDEEKQEKQEIKGDGFSASLTWKQKFNKELGYDKDEPHDKEELSDITGIPIKYLDEIYDRGIGAWKTNIESVRMKDTFKKNPNVKTRSRKLPKEQWAMARVYSFLGGNPKQVGKGKPDHDVLVKLVESGFI